MQPSDTCPASNSASLWALHCPKNTHHREKDHCMAGLHFNKKGTDQKESMLLFVWREAVESKLYNWRPAVQWSFLLRWVFSGLLFRHHFKYVWLLLPVFCSTPWRPLTRTRVHCLSSASRCPSSTSSSSSSSHSSSSTSSWRWSSSRSRSKEKPNYRMGKLIRIRFVKVCFDCN